MTVAADSDQEVSSAEAVEKARAARRAGDRETALLWFKVAAEQRSGDAPLLFDVATELRELKRFAEAEAAFVAVLAVEPTHAQALKGAGLMARQRSDRAEALKFFQAAVEARPDDLWSRQEVASELRDLRRFDEAEAAYEAVLELDGAFAPALRGLGLVARLKGDRDTALARFEAAAVAKPDDIWSHQEAATELRELGRFEEAETAYGQALALDEKFVPALRGLALVARQHGDREEALRRFQAAADAKPSDLNSHHDVAIELRELGRFEEARAVYEQVLAKDARFVPALRGLGIIARQYGDREEALARFRAAVAASPDIWLNQEVAAELLELGRFEEAEACAEEVRAKRPQSARAWVLYAQCAKHRLSSEELLEVLETAVSIEPEEVAGLMALAAEQQRRAALAEAEELYERVLALNPSHMQAALELTNIAARRQGGPLDVARIRQAASGVNFNEAALIACARELGQRKAFAEAEECLGEVLARFPIHYAARMQAASLKRLQGDLRAAYRHHARLAGHYPRRPEPLVEMANDALQLGNPADAVGSLSLALKIRPGFGPALNALAQLANQSDQVETALALYQKALSRQPYAIQPATGAAQCLANLGRVAEYETLMQSLLQRHGASPPVLTARANIELQLGRYAEARAVAEALRAASLTDYGSLVARVIVYLRSGDLDAAEEALSQASNLSAVNLDKLRIHAARYALARWRPEIALRLLEGPDGAVSTGVRNDDLAARAAFLAGRWQSLERHLQSQLKSAASYRQLRNLPSHISQSHLGQLLDEARLEPEAAERITALHAMPGHARLDEAIALAKAYPDYTPAAIAVFMELRRRGRLALAPASEEERDLIPKRLSQYWDADTPPADVVAYCETWRVMNPDFAYRRYSEDEASDFLEKTYPPEILEAFERAPEPAMKADLFRLALLLAEGGYYADADDRCLSSIADHAPKGRELVLYQEDLGTIGNDFMGVVPNHPVIRLALDQAVEAIRRNDNDILWLSTGPGLITRSLAMLALKDGASLEDFLGRIHIFDNHEIRRIFAPHCAASYKYSSKHWSRTSYKKVRSKVSHQLEKLLTDVLEG